MKKIEIIVTKNPIFAEYLRERRETEDNVQVISHVENPTVLLGKVVAGDLPLPLPLLALCRCFIEIQFPVAVNRPRRTFIIKEVAGLAFVPARIELGHLR